MDNAWKSIAVRIGYDEVHLGRQSANRIELSAVSSIDRVSSGGSADS